MFFLLRMAFWLGLVLVLLPTDKKPDANQPEVAASDAISAASAAVSDMAQFCDRQPAACSVGGQAASVIGARAQAGAKKVYQFITEKNEKPDDAQIENNKIETNKIEKPAEKAFDKKPHDKAAGRHSERRDRRSSDHTGSIDMSERVSDDQRSDALTADDLAIEWQSPVL